MDQGLRNEDALVENDRLIPFAKDAQRQSLSDE